MNLWLEFRRKYGPGAEAVREKREALRRRLASQGDVEARVSKLKAEAAKVEKDLRKQAEALRAARTKAADKLATAARKMLGSLGFKKADLRIEVAVRCLRVRRLHMGFAEVGDFLAEHQGQAGHAQQQQEQGADQAGPLVDQEPGFDGGTLH